MTDVPIVGLIIWGAIYVGIVGFYGPVMRAADRAWEATLRFVEAHS